MIKEVIHDVLGLFSGTVTEVGAGTLAAMGLAFAIAKWERRHATEQGDSKDHRESAYQTLLHAVDRFTHQDSSQSPMRVRSDWATVAHALETSKVLSREIRTKSQKRIWAIELEYFRRVMLSELKTEEAFLGSLSSSESVLASFNHQPCERHLVPVLNWIVGLDAEEQAPKILHEALLTEIHRQGMPLLAEKVRQWCAMDQSEPVRASSKAIDLPENRMQTCTA